MTKKLGDTLARLSEDQLLDWAADLVDEITDEHVKALQVFGWKIVNITPGGGQWPFDSEETGCACPSWYDDLTPKAKVLPFKLIDGGKKDEP